jgi:hypothetical protein
VSSFQALSSRRQRHADGQRVFTKALQRSSTRTSKDIPCHLSACNEIRNLQSDAQLKNRSISVRPNSWDSLHHVIKATAMPQRAFDRAIADAPAYSSRP